MKIRISRIELGEKEQFARQNVIEANFGKAEIIYCQNLSEKNCSEVIIPPSTTRSNGVSLIEIGRGIFGRLKPTTPLRLYYNCTLVLHLDMGRLPFAQKNRNFRGEVQMVRSIPLEYFRKVWKTSNVFHFSHSKRNDRNFCTICDSFSSQTPSDKFFACLATSNKANWRAMFNVQANLYNYKLFCFPWTSMQWEV